MPRVSTHPRRSSSVNGTNRDSSSSERTELRSCQRQSRHSSSLACGKRRFQPEESVCMSREVNPWGRGKMPPRGSPVKRGSFSTTAHHVGWGDGGGTGGGGGGGGIPTGTGGSGPCVGGGNVLHVVVADGGAFGGTQWSGPYTTPADAGAWTAFLDPTQRAPSVRYSDPSNQWDTIFSVLDTDAGVLVPGTYNPAADYFEAWATHLPGLSISDTDGGGYPCSGDNQGGPIGQFIIDEFSVGADGGVGTITASFLKYCNGVQADWVYGCVHYVSP